MALIKKSDYINSFKLIKAEGGDVSIQEREAKNIIHEIMKQEVSVFFNNKIIDYELQLHRDLTKTFENIEGRLVTFIEAKADAMCLKICDAVITRVFQVEVEKKAKELLLKRGKF